MLLLLLLAYVCFVPGGNTRFLRPNLLHASAAKVLHPASKGPWLPPLFLLPPHLQAYLAFGDEGYLNMFKEVYAAAMTNLQLDPAFHGTIW